MALQRVRGPLKVDIEALYREHGHVVLLRARAILGNEDDAREMLQQIFVSFIEKPAQLDGVRSMVAFLYGVTTHRCLNRLRDRSNRARLVELHVRPAATTAQSTSSIGAAERAQMRQVLARLPQELAEVAVYYYLDELTHDEIARVLGCSRRHVGDLLERFHEHADKLVRAA